MVTSLYLPSMTQGWTLDAYLGGHLHHSDKGHNPKAPVALCGPSCLSLASAALHLQANQCPGTGEETATQVAPCSAASLLGGLTIHTPPGGR